MKLSIDMDQRFAKMRAHTATHLLHAELAKIFPDTKQAGSLVDSDLLRFDFYANNLLSEDQIHLIENNVNQIIFSALPVDLIETTFDEGVKLGAKAFFEEKYGDKVRVICVHDGDRKVSVELCGGTHVSNTKEIGAFSIVSQEAVASGIKRITAYTGPKVIEKIHYYEKIMDESMESLDVKSYVQINEKINKFLRENTELKQRVESLENNSIRSLIVSSEAKSNGDFSKIIELPNGTNFKVVSNILGQIFTDAEVVLLYTQEGNYVIFSASNSSSAKDLAKKYSLRGGGSHVIAQGKDLGVMNIVS